MAKFLFVWAAFSEFGALVAVFQIDSADGYTALITTVALGLQAIIAFGFGAVVHALKQRNVEQDAALPVNT